MSDTEIPETPGVELWLDKRAGWMLTVPERVPESGLRLMIAYALPVYEKMHKDMPSTPATLPEKRRLERAIKDLQELKVTQVMTRKGLIL